MGIHPHFKARAGVIVAVHYLSRPRRLPVCRIMVETANDIRQFNVAVLGKWWPQEGQWIYTRGTSIDIMFDDPRHLEPTTVPFTRCSAITYLGKKTPS